MNPPKIQFCVNRQGVAEITVSPAIVEALEQFIPAMQRIAKTEALCAKLLEILCARLPAKRGAILLAPPNTEDLIPVAFAGTAFEVSAEMSVPTYRDRIATVTASAMCVPLWWY